MRTPCALSALLMCLSLPPAAWAQPAQISRILRTFDFEERQLGNVEDLPMHWSKVQGPGLPHYVNGRLSNDRAHSGSYSFRLDLNGGSVIYRYDADQIRVQPGAHYRVEGKVQTTPLPHARARITAYFVDQDGRMIPGSLRHSQLFSSPPGDKSWHSVGLEISSQPDDAGQADHQQAAPASLVIELGLVQPMLYAPPLLGQRTLFPQDIRGSAWFDDVTVSQVPKVTLSTDRAGNIFGRSDPLVLKVLVNDRFTDDLAAQLLVSDAQGRAVYQRSGALDMSAAQSLGPGRKRMTLMLPQLPPGWFQAALVMSSKGQFVGRQTLDFVLLADEAAGASPDPRFGIVATDLPMEGWDDLPELLSILSAGRVKLAVWSETADVQQPGSATRFDRLLERLGELRIEPTACLAGVPPTILQKLQQRSWQQPSEASRQAQVDESPWLQLLKADAQLWQPQLAYLVARHAAHLSRWQVGADGSDEFVTDPRMRQVYDRLYEEFARLMQRPDLAMPWPAWYELSGRLPATVALHIKPGVLPSQVPLYVNDLGANENLSIFLEPLAREQYGRDVQIRDLAQRIVYALSANVQRIDLKLPFAVQGAHNDPGGDEHELLVKQPQELFIIIRTIMSMLSGASFRGKLPIAEGVEAFLFDRGGQGVLVLWDRGVSGGVRQLAIDLGRQPRCVDLWGNVTPLVHAQQADGGESASVRLPIGPMPIFLVDIDAQLAQLRASVTLDNPLLESSFKPHTRRIRFTNPYPQAISGSFKLLAPPGWTINPPTQTFSLNPGETLQRELTIEFPYNSFAGTKFIQAQFNVQADTNSTFITPIALKLGLSDVGLQTLALRDGNDVIVQQMITNYGQRPIDYTAFALCPGHARQERLVTNLAPGRTTIKKYRFQNVKLTAQSKIRSGLKELDGTRILNEEVAVQ